MNTIPVSSGIAWRMSTYADNAPAEPQRLTMRKLPGKTPPPGPTEWQKALLPLRTTHLDYLTESAAWNVGVADGLLAARHDKRLSIEAVGADGSAHGLATEDALAGRFSSRTGCDH